jgi:hypothetical protein
MYIYFIILFNRYGRESGENFSGEISQSNGVFRKMVS